jgi:hypothetical protein
MLLYHIKILLRYRQVLFVPITIILCLLFFKYFLLPKNMIIRTVVPFCMFVFCLVEDLYNNTFDMSSNEFRLYQLFPIKYRKMIIIKNYAVFIVIIVYSILVSLLAIYALQISLYAVYLSIIYSLTICFPIVTIGNIVFTKASKLNSPNYALIRMILNVIIVAILSLPYLILKIALKNILFCYPYILIAILFWWYVSIPIASKQLSKNTYKILGSI